MRQYKLGGGATTTILLGGVQFTSGLARVSDKVAEFVELYHVRYLGVERDTAGEAAGGWPAGPTAGETAMLAAESRLGDLQNMSLADVITEGKAYEVVGGSKQRIIAAIMDREHPGLYTLHPNFKHENTVNAIDGSLSITTQPAGGTDGAACSTQPVVKMLRPNGLVDADYTGSITATITDAADGVLIGTVTLACVAGVATFTNVGLNNGQAGASYQMTFTTAGGGNAVTSSAITCTAAVAAKLGLGTPLQSATAADGVALAVQPKILIQDALGRTMTASTLVVTAAKQSGASTLGGTLTATAVAGVATFTNLAYTGAGTNVTRFSSGALTTVDAAAVVVS